MKRIIIMIVSFLAGIYRQLTTAKDLNVVLANELTYDDAVSTGVFDAQVDIQYDDRIFDDRILKARMTWLLKKMSKSVAKTSIQRAFDRTTLKDIISLAQNVTPADSLDNETTLTLGANVKDNLLENQLISFGFTPTGANYTNIGIVTSKAGPNTQVKIKPYDPAKIFGINTATAIPAQTRMSIEATAFPYNSGSVKPISAQPHVIENWVQVMKSPYGYDDIAAAENLYTKGGIKYQKDKDAKEMLLLYAEKMLLSDIPGRYKKTARLGNSDDEVQIGIMRGLEHMLKYGDTVNGIVSPAVKSYTNWSYDVFDQWQWELFSPDLDDVADVRTFLCNKAMRKFFTDMAKERNWTIEKSSDYGLPGVTTVHCDAGDLDLIVHSRLHAKYPSMDKPFGMALTLPYVEFKEMLPAKLYANIHARDWTGQKSEYRWAWTYILHGLGTAYHGIIFPLVP